MTQSIYESYFNVAVMPIFARTISADLIPVVPLCGTKEENDRISQEVFSENRNRKIDSVIDGKKFEEMKINEHPNYKGPNAELFYINYVYGTSSV